MSNKKEQSFSPPAEEQLTPDEAIERFVRKRAEQLAKYDLGFPPEIKESIPKIIRFFQEYFDRLGIDPSVEPGFTGSGVGNISEWAQSINMGYLDQEGLGAFWGEHNKNMVGLGYAPERTAVIGKQAAETGGVEMMRFYGPAALAHELHHALTAAVFTLRENVPITPESADKGNWKRQTADTLSTARLYTSVNADMNEDGTPEVEDGFYVINGTKSQYSTEEYFYYPKTEEEEFYGRLYRQGNLLEEGFTTIIETRVRDMLADQYPETKARHDKAVEAYLATVPKEWHFKEGLYLSDGFPISDDPEKAEIARKFNIGAGVYRPGVRLFRLVEQGVNKEHGAGDPLYFERLVQRARVLGRHQELWDEITKVFGPELAERIKYSNFTKPKRAQEVIDELAAIVEG